MNLYKVTQEENNGYDTYDSAIVAAETEEDSKKVMSLDGLGWATKVESVKSEFIGVAKEGTKRDIIVASYNAG